MSADDTAPSDVPDRFAVDFTGLTLLGIYRVDEKMADGGMGSIYLGEDTNLGRKVVIKVPHVRFLGEPGFRARFRLEISELVRLEHPSIVRILAQGDHEDVPFFVLQYLGGGSLEDVLGKDEEPATIEDTLAWFAPIARTLDFVHTRGTVHRDVKPANIIFDEDGHVFLSDFGVAKALGNQDLDLTAAGTGIGSPRYMAPEQAIGGDLGPSADQYALASMVYEALAGTPPFDEPSTIELLVAKKSSDAPPLAEVAPAVPAAAAASIMKALERDASDRHESCSALLSAFQDGLAPEPDPADSPTPKRSASRTVLVALGCLLVLLGTVGVLMNLRDLTEAPPAATNATEDIRLALVDPGSEPRRSMRYDLQRDAVERVRMVTRIRRTFEGNEEAAADMPLPETTWHFEMRVDDVTEDGCYTLHWRVLSVDFDWTGGEAPQAFLAVMEELKPQYETFACHVEMTPNGLAREARMLLPDDTAAAVRVELERLFVSIRSLALRFPVEPIGAGARWEVSETVTMMGARITHTETYELEKLDGGQMSVVMNLAQTGAKQDMDMSWLGPHIGATLLSVHATGEADIEADLMHALPRMYGGEASTTMDVWSYVLGDDGSKPPGPPPARGEDAEGKEDETSQLQRVIVDIKTNATRDPDEPGAK